MPIDRLPSHGSFKITTAYDVGLNDKERVILLALGSRDEEYRPSLKLEEPDDVRLLIEALRETALHLWPGERFK